MSNISPKFENFLAFFKNEAESPTNIIITPCPKANRKSIKAALIKFLLNVAKLIIEARIGVEQGVVANAKTAPTING